jgi:dephospho-CoA kinase
MNDKTTVPFIIFITGASGAGKTALIDRISAMLPQDGECFHFDSIGVPSVEEMTQKYGSPSEWQKAMTEQWVAKLTRDYRNKKLLVLEGQVNMDFIASAMAHVKHDNYEIILVHCDKEVRHKRLLENRVQPELINDDMDMWAFFLKRQAEQKRTTILDSTVRDKDDMAEWFLRHLKKVAPGIY